MQKLFFLMVMMVSLCAGHSAFAQKKSKPAPKLYYGTASYYADKFEGRQTANGEIFRHNKMTAACNVVPLGTWLKITNLKNKKSVTVRVTDRLHPKNKRIVDLPKVAAKELKYYGSGLTKVKVEVLNSKR